MRCGGQRMRWGFGKRARLGGAVRPARADTHWGGRERVSEVVLPWFEQAGRGHAPFCVGRGACVAAAAACVARAAAPESVQAHPGQVKQGRAWAAGRARPAVARPVAAMDRMVVESAFRWSETLSPRQQKARNGMDWNGLSLQSGSCVLG